MNTIIKEVLKKVILAIYFQFINATSWGLSMKENLFHQSLAAF